MKIQMDEEPEERVGVTEYFYNELPKWAKEQIEPMKKKKQLPLQPIEVAKKTNSVNY